MAPIDPHSFTDSMHPLTKHVHLSLYFDFNSKTIDGSAILTLESPYSGDLYLDTRCLKIHGVYNDASNSASPSAYIPFILENPDPIKGSLLRVSLINQSSFAIIFKTHQSASAIQWLNPAQTAGKKIPVCIHSMPVYPCSFYIPLSGHSQSEDSVLGCAKHS